MTFIRQRQWMPLQANVYVLQSRSIKSFITSSHCGRLAVGLAVALRYQLDSQCHWSYLASWSRRQYPVDLTAGSSVHWHLSLSLVCGWLLHRLCSFTSSVAIFITTARTYCDHDCWSPRLGVYYFLSLTLSVCPSVCHGQTSNWFFFFVSW